MRTDKYRVPEVNLLPKEHKDKLRLVDKITDDVMQADNEGMSGVFIDNSDIIESRESDRIWEITRRFAKGA